MGHSLNSKCSLILRWVGTESQRMNIIFSCCCWLRLLDVVLGHSFVRFISWLAADGGDSEEEEEEEIYLAQNQQIKCKTNHIQYNWAGLPENPKVTKSSHWVAEPIYTGIFKELFTTAQIPRIEGPKTDASGRERGCVFAYRAWRQGERPLSIRGLGKHCKFPQSSDNANFVSIFSTMRSVVCVARWCSG